MVDLRKINTLIADDYINNNRPVGTLTDATQHLGGKTCSASLLVPRRITAFKWPTRNQANSLHSTSQVEYSHTEDWHKDLVVPCRHFRPSYANMNPVLKADQSAQYVNDIGMAAISTQQLIKNLRAVFQYLRKAGFKLSKAKFRF